MIEHVQVHGPDPVALDALESQLHAVKSQPSRNLAQHLLRRPRVEQRGQHHVAGQPADAVQVGKPHNCPPSCPRAIRAAIVPAPNPSSIPTTASAAAHEVSIARSAVRPPSATP